MDKILKQFGKEKIEQIVLNSNSFVEATSLLGLKPFQKKNVERSIKRLNLSVQHFDSVQRVKNSKTRYTKEKLEILVKTCKNYKEILSELDILPISTNYTMLKKKLREFQIDFSHLKNQKRTDVKLNWSKENLQAVISESKTQNQVLEKMGLRSAGGNFITLRKYIALYNLDTSHFTKDYEFIANLQKENAIPLCEILVVNSTYSNRSKLKERLYKEGLKTRFCELCGQGEEWKGKKMSLILDHINGVHNDNRIENLRIVCPNCNATLDTHCGKKLSKNRKNQVLKPIFNNI